MTTPDAKFGSADPYVAFFDLAIEDEPVIESPESPGAASPERPGEVIAGRYVLKSLLGEGGTGQVWHAEQTEPVRREVAVKIIRPGLLSKPVSARFNREHQVLARMEHPNIAAVFDAGELPDGRTYFAMEAVSGAAITRWCRDHGLKIPERLDIFLQACMAVHHAHQKGILHRDLKPSNVMVTEVDGKPVVKVIDFGIAKTLEGDLWPLQEVTLRGMVMGTPEYMSPEQAGLTGLELDARTDVYALGVLLYELLTGTTPIHGGMPADMALPELLERVRHAETEMPSRRAARGGVLGPNGRSVARELRGDLDWIALRALQKERAQRYPTAQALAEDVQRHLRDEPVAAGPPGVVYRTKKWLVRQKSALITGAAVLISLAGGLAATFWALEREELQRQDAQRLKQLALNESALAKVVSAQFEELLDNARKHAEAGMNTEMLRNLADECAAGMPRFANQPRTEARLADQLTQLYEVLGEPVRALPWAERRWEAIRQVEGDSAPAALEALYAVGWRLIPHDPGRAADVLQKVVEGYAALPAADAATQAQALVARKDRARALSRAFRHQEAVSLIAEVIREKGETDPAQAAAWMRDQAHVLRSSGQVEAAKTVLRRAIDLVPKDEASVGLHTYLLTTLAWFDGTAEEHAAALAASARRVQKLEVAHGEGHPRVLTALIDHAMLACRIPGCPGGEAAARKALERAQSAGQESRLADAWIAVSETLRIGGQLRESEQSVRDAIREVSQTKAEKWRVLELHRRLGDLLTARNDFAGALECYETAAAGWFASNVTNRPREKERLIFTSFITFWELAAAARSPLAEAQHLAEWRRKLAAWEAARGGLWSSQTPSRAQSAPALP